MRESNMTSYMVYNFLKERQSTYSCPQRKTQNTKLNWKMQYTQLIPDTTPLFNHHNKYRSFYASLSKKSSTNKKMRPLKRIFEYPLQYQPSICQPQKIKLTNKIGLGLQYLNNKQINNIYKIQERQQSPNLLEESQKKAIIQNKRQFFQKVSTNKIKKNIKYHYNNKFGLYIQKIKQIQQLQQNNNKQISQINQTNAMTIDKSQQINNKNNQLQKQQQKCKTQKSQKLMQISKILTNTNKIKKFSIRKQKKYQDQKNIQYRLQRLFQYYNIILYSYGYFNIQCQDIIIGSNKKKNNKYLYFVGGGNNKNLIVSIMKKRWWWGQTDDINSADLVWTQLKVHSIIRQQSSTLALPNPQIYINDKNILKKRSFPQKQQYIIYHKLFHNKIDNKFYKKLSKQQQKKYLLQLKIPKVLHNHYQCNYMLGNKKALYYNLLKYYQYLNKNVYDIIPQTYHIQKINSKNWKIFQKYIKNNNQKQLWLVKPGQNSNRGKGIIITQSLQKIKKKIQNNKNKHTYIIQKYIKNLLLYQKRKFDIRTYLLMNTIGGVYKFYWYSQGYIRTSSQIYDLKNLDPFIHLTNDAIQNQHQNYGKYQSGNKISYNQFQRYLDNNYQNNKYSIKVLVQKMKNIALQVTKATYFKINPLNKQNGFQLFGLDFIIDNQFNPWLLQINTNPCLQLSSIILQRIIPRMIQNIFRIAVDPIYQPISDCPRSMMYYIPDNIIQNNKFQLIFDSMFDRDYQWEKYANQLNQNIQYQDQDQQFQGDGQIIAIDY